MYDHSSHREINHFRRYYLYVFITEEILKRHIKDGFTINSKQTVMMLNKGEYVKFKTFERIIKSSFMICEEFQNILELEYNGKQNSNESNTNKYQKHIAYSYGYKLV